MKTEPTVGYESGEKRRPWLRNIFVLSAILLGMMTATQHFAHHFGVNRSALIDCGVYSPAMIVVWHWAWRGKFPAEFRISLLLPPVQRLEWRGDCLSWFVDGGGRRALKRSVTIT